MPSDTHTQDAPNISIEHQKEGDARRPKDTLDREQDETSGGNAPEDVEDRSNVGTVEPSDYPEQQ